ncbi:MAG: hypothetical protein M3O32_05570 [Actinomycetota bacterium]|nr:hypothetical protein [Actinomycetota bacterium]
MAGQQFRRLDMDGTLHAGGGKVVLGAVEHVVALMISMLWGSDVLGPRQ